MDEVETLQCRTNRMSGEDTKQIFQTYINYTIMNTFKNTVSLQGRLGQEPELKTSGKKGEYTYLRLSLAINENYKNNTGQWVENTQWHNLIVWGKTAEKMASRVSKGSEIIILGKLRNSVYGEGAEKKYSTDVEVIEFHTLSSFEKAKEVEPAKN